MVDVAARAAVLVTSQLDKQSFDGDGAKIGKTIARGAKIGAASLVALAAGAKVAIDAASDLNESASKSEVVFGAQAKAIDRFASSAAKNLGQSKTQALEAASTFGIIAQGAGLSGKAAADFSKQFTTLASDMASFSNTSPEEAITAIGSAMRGEAEPIRRYGVLLDDATLRNEALKKGLISSIKQSLTPQQKALAAAAVIMKQTSKAQGDFARTSKGAANQSRILAAQSENLKARLGTGLLPTYIKLQQAGIKFVQILADHPRATKAAVIAVSALSAAFLALGAASVVASGIAAIGGATVLGPILAVGAALTAVGFILTKLWQNSDTFRIFVSKSFDGVIQIVRLALLAFQGLFSALSHVPGFGWAGAIAKSIDTVRTKLNDLSTSIDDHARHYDKVKKAATSAFDEVARLQVLQLLPQKLAAGFAKLPKNVQVDFATNFPQTSKDVASLAKEIKGVSDTQIQLLIDSSGVKTTVKDVRKQITALKKSSTKIEFDANLDKLNTALKGTKTKISKTELKALIGADPKKANDVYNKLFRKIGSSKPTPKLNLDKTTADNIIDKFIKNSKTSKKDVKVNLQDADAKSKLVKLVAQRTVSIIANILPGGSTGGRIPSGFAGGGKVPGRGPSNGRDNVLARTAKGNPLMVRSGEWIINEKDSKKNSKLLAMINDGFNAQKAFGFRSGGQVGGSSSTSTRTETIQHYDVVQNLNFNGPMSGADFGRELRWLSKYTPTYGTEVHKR